MIQAILTQSAITSASTDAFALQQKSHYGEKKQGKIHYTPDEALHLVNTKKMNLTHNNKTLTPEQTLSKLKKQDKDLETKQIVYNDLRKRGHIPKTALKYGTHYRIYTKGNKPGKNHAKYLAHITTENQKITWHDYTAKTRVAHSTKKTLLLCIIDHEHNITYYETDWKKM